MLDTTPYGHKRNERGELSECNCPFCEEQYHQPRRQAVLDEIRRLAFGRPRRWPRIDPATVTTITI